MSSKQNYIRDQIIVIEDKDKKGWIESFYNIKTFSVTYNSIANKNPNLSHDIEEFLQKQFLIAKFSTYNINFTSKNKLNDIFNFNSHLFNVYLIDEGL